MSQTTKKAKTWKDLKDTTKPKKTPLSFSKSLKSFFAYLKYAILLAILLCLCLGGYFLYKTQVIEGYVYNDSQKIKTFLFKKDKNITGQWLYKFTGIKPSMPLDSIDIFDIKTRIEALDQVGTVKIEKIYPETLKIEIIEKDYIAKTYKNGKLLIMSSHGEFYEPICFSEELLATLLELSDLELKEENGKYSTFEKAPKLQELIFSAKNTEGINFKSWKKINLQKSNYLVEPLMEIHTLDNIKIVFSFDNYNEELKKLKSILEFSKKNNLELSIIDLSLKDRADVKAKEEE